MLQRSYFNFWVMGMGKLGARELNVSSDIDLVYVYEQNGETAGNAHGRGRISNQEYFAKAVRGILAHKLVPSLAAGRHVVSDRSVDSTLAYQGYGRRLPLEDIRRFNDWAIRGRWPDLAILIEVDPARVVERIRDRVPDRLERESRQFHQRVRAGFARMAAEDPTRWIVIDGNATPRIVRQRIRVGVTRRLGL